MLLLFDASVHVKHLVLFDRFCLVK